MSRRTRRAVWNVLRLYVLVVSLSGLAYGIDQLVTTGIGEAWPVTAAVFGFLFLMETGP